MKKAGGHRNFGYGKQMAWAGKQALKDQYGNGHYGTVIGHAERWRRFVTWCRDECDIRDARLINSEVVQDYGKSLRDKVDAGMSPAYAQNLLSSVNVVMQAMRSDRQIRVAPVEFVGQRSRTRTDPPTGLDQNVVRQCADQLRQNGHERVAATVEVARALGLRLKEASLLNARVALGQVKKHGAVNITAGTKGGRGHMWIAGSRSRAPRLYVWCERPGLRDRDVILFRPTSPGNSGTRTSIVSGPRSETTTV